MKQFIVLCATMVLGIFIFNLIAGSGEDSIFTAMQAVWRKGVEVRTYTP